MFTIPIDKKCKLEIINTLATMESELFKNISPLEFFDSILNLRILASEDPRYQDAYGDLNQHYINNNDWTLEYILLERFDFFKIRRIIYPITQHTGISIHNENRCE
ncbi:TPA: hypothetical protein ACNV0S_002022 [Proteus mirabilis]|uniref:AbiJ-related protein n=1 Tax=Proteus mirabilis TaxID=584 RepID=UPI001F49FE59|nr:hypothetical protein [Proteus mirabilis]MCZ4601325.1 hypothetical protein [Proteus mirabilis]MDF7256403.1 hypothetical protein [Proteus mirabilis]MDF7350236.1 hypothetical protein [Proteus mirabilis]